MNKKIIGMVISIVAVALIAFVVVLALRQNAPGQDDAANDSANSAQSEGDKTQDTGSEGRNNNTGVDSGSQNSDGSGTGEVKTAEIEIDDMAFKTASLTIKRGTTVKWTNKDSMQHTVSSAAGVENGPQSELLARGESYSFTFTKAGSFSYFCELHPQMKGSIKVE